MKREETWQIMRKTYGKSKNESLENLGSVDPSIFDSSVVAGAPTFDPLSNQPIDLKKHRKAQEEQLIQQDGLLNMLRQKASGPADGIPIWQGLALLTLLGFLHARNRAREERLRSLEIAEVVDGHREVLAVQGPWHIHAYALLPLRFISRLWGRFCNLTIPNSLRNFVYGTYAKSFGVDMTDALEEDFGAYPTLSDFFLRKLKPSARIIDTNVSLVSPCDGTVLTFGLVTDRRIEQVKGFTYSLDHFLGNSHHPISKTEIPLLDPSTVKDLVKSSKSEEVVAQEDFAEINGLNYSLSDLLGPEQTGKNLWFTVIYLSPGDYHRFHSPTDWIISKRRHFAGDLFSVSPWIVERLKNLFVLNERVAILGRWRFGFMSMTAVGATNVGSISLAFDEELKTNKSVIKEYREKREWHPPGTFTEKTFTSGIDGIPTTRGSELGAFRLGSTVVLVFEAPSEFEFKLEHGQKIRLGEPVGHVAMERLGNVNHVEREASWTSWLKFW